MSEVRIFVLAGAFLIGAAAPSAASDGDGIYNGATQRSIYDVVRGKFLESYSVPVVMEGRSATAAPLPSDEQETDEGPSQEPFYMRNESRTAD